MSNKISKLYLIIILMILLLLNLMPNKVLAENNRAVSIGTNFYLNGVLPTPGEGQIDTTEMATHARTSYGLAGYTSHLITEPTYGQITGYYQSDNVPVLSCDILFLAGHGSYDHIRWNFQQKGGDYSCGLAFYEGDLITDNVKFSGLKNMRQGSVKLAILAACNTANTDTTSNNLCQKIFDKGTDNVLGWRDDVNCVQLTKFMKHFNFALASRI